ncbi:hypothetical protein CDD80_104 [Ophiocordyceps camponoti-rufipedis]|uniref:Uncharacterized protein n=1 Tax=Ophiocordyceps camponoti-rufipedis TaxID=2004952 RepID=A0A2C5ZDU4_9HYPO|nr:hypothetical protein CDD80_104 [Ophiocordyceps camponoti-rufipedis]
MEWIKVSPGISLVASAYLPLVVFHPPCVPLPGLGHRAASAIASGSRDATDPYWIGASHAASPADFGLSLPPRLRAVSNRLGSWAVHLWLPTSGCPPLAAYLHLLPFSHRLTPPFLLPPIRFSRLRFSPLLFPPLPSPPLLSSSPPPR